MGQRHSTFCTQLHTHCSTANQQVAEILTNVLEKLTWDELIYLQTQKQKMIIPPRLSFRRSTGTYTPLNDAFDR